MREFPREISDYDAEAKRVDEILRGGPGGPYDSGMEQRVTRLEEDIKEIKGDLKSLRSDVAELKGRVSMLPGYGGIALIVGLVVGLSTAVQIAARFMPPG